MVVRGNLLLGGSTIALLLLALELPSAKTSKAKTRHSTAHLDSSIIIIMTEGKEGPEVVGAIAEETPHPRREARQDWMFQSTYLPDDCTHFTASRSKGGDDSVKVADHPRSSGSKKSISKIPSKPLRVGFRDELSVHAVKSAGSSQQGDDSTWRGFRILVPTCFLPKAGQKSVEEHGDATQSRAGLSTVTFEQSGSVCSPKTIVSPCACIGFILLLIVCCVAVMVTCGTGNCNYQNQRTMDPPTELSSFPSPSPSSLILSIQFKTNSPTPVPWKFFESTEELYEAVDAYLDNDSPTSVTAQVYGHPIGTWLVGRLANFSHVFDADRNAAAGNFTADLSGWDTSRATTMRFMFRKAERFNGDVSSFDTSSVVDMEAMFLDCREFDSNISQWRTGSVTNFRDFLGRATSFSGDLSDWDTSSATDFSGMFRLVESFNSNLQNWQTGLVTNSSKMFLNCISFEGRGLERWDVSNVQDMLLMFAGAGSFDQNLCPWGVQLAALDQVDMRGMFFSSACPVKNDPDPNNIASGPFCRDCNTVRRRAAG